MSNRAKFIELEAIKAKINDELHIDMAKRTRRRDVVDGRRIFTMVARKLPYGHAAIGKSINKTHCMSMHYMKTGQNLLEVDTSFRKKFERVKKLLEE